MKVQANEVSIYSVKVGKRYETSFLHLWKRFIVFKRFIKVHKKALPISCVARNCNNKYGFGKNTNSHGAWPAKTLKKEKK